MSVNQGQTNSTTSEETDGVPLFADDLSHSMTTKHASPNDSEVLFAEESTETAKELLFVTEDETTTASDIVSDEDLLLVSDDEDLAMAAFAAPAKTQAADLDDDFSFLDEDLNLNTDMEPPVQSEPEPTGLVEEALFESDSSSDEELLFSEEVTDTALFENSHDDAADQLFATTQDTGNTTATDVTTDSSLFSEAETDTTVHTDSAPLTAEDNLFQTESVFEEANAFESVDSQKTPESSDIAMTGAALLQDALLTEDNKNTSQHDTVEPTDDSDAVFSHTEINQPEATESTQNETTENVFSDTVVAADTIDQANTDTLIDDTLLTAQSDSETVVSHTDTPAGLSPLDALQLDHLHSDSMQPANDTLTTPAAGLFSDVPTGDTIHSSVTAPASNAILADTPIQVTNNTNQDTSRLAFYIGKSPLMIPLDEGNMLLDMPKVFKLPNTASWFLGYSNINGVLVPIFNVAEFLNLDTSDTERAENHATSKLLVVTHDENTAGIIINSLPKRLRLHDANTLTVDHATTALMPYVQNAFQLHEQIWYDLNIYELLDALEQRVQA